MTNWYVRRSRDRFWAGDQEAIDTLHTVLHVLCRVIAPLQPLVADEIFRGLTGERSVHLNDWPSTADLPADPGLVAAMDGVRDVCSTALSVRKAHNRRVRLPLRSLTVASPDLSSAAAFADIIRDEVNVRDVVFTNDVGAVASRELQVLPKVLGPRLGSQVQAVIAAVKKGDWSIEDGVPVVGGVRLNEGEFTLKLVAAPGSASAALGSASGVVVLDVEVTPELEAEGAARDMVRTLQQTRRALDLNVSDRVSVSIDGPAALLAQLEAHREMIAGEVLATSVLLGAAQGEAQHVETIDGAEVRVWMAVAS
jgi:isoleucyl-tRNA synthetase